MIHASYTSVPTVGARSRIAMRIDPSVVTAASPDGPSPDVAAMTAVNAPGSVAASRTAATCCW